MMTIQQEIEMQRSQYIAQYGSDFVDLILVSKDKHGDGKVGYSCSLAGYQTYASGVTLTDFARWAFGFGKLRKVSETRYVVFRTT